MGKKTWFGLGGIAAVSAAACYICASSRAAAERVDYEVIENAGRFEVRRYEQLAVAVAEASEDDRDSAFRRLFRFISRQNSAAAKISMTTPVLIDRRADGVQMSFILPSHEPGPQPIDRDVTIGKREGGRVAVLRFGGFSSRRSEDAALESLRAILQQRGLRDTGDPIVAYYDAPWTPPPFRRNEVMLRLK